MTLILRLVLLIICIASIAFTISVLLSGALRSAYVFTIERKIALIWPPEYAFVGDSLTTGCNWRWELGKLSVINLGGGGTEIRDITRQMNQALALKANIILIEGGINDVIFGSASIERIGRDFEFLLQQLPVGQKAVITLIPFVSNRSLSNRIEAANSTIKLIVEARRLPIIDLNDKLASGRVRRTEMTTDGIHFNHRACQIWADQIRAIVDSLK
jgi:lysophospholipase L1-like esterase